MKSIKHIIIYLFVLITACAQKNQVKYTKEMEAKRYNPSIYNLIGSDREQVELFAAGGVGEAHSQIITRKLKEDGGFNTDFEYDFGNYVIHLDGMSESKVNDFLSSHSVCYSDELKLLFKAHDKQTYTCMDGDDWVILFFDPSNRLKKIYPPKKRVLYLPPQPTVAKPL